MKAFVILSKAKDLTTGVTNTKRLSRDQSPWGGPSPFSRFGMTVRQLTEQPE
jgi:hypothetical protein